jgi:hypothetical protein
VNSTQIRSASIVQLNIAPQHGFATLWVYVQACTSISSFCFSLQVSASDASATIWNGQWKGSACRSGVLLVVWYIIKINERRQDTSLRSHFDTHVRKFDRCCFNGHPCQGLDVTTRWNSRGRHGNATIISDNQFARIVMQFKLFLWPVRDNLEWLYIARITKTSKAKQPTRRITNALPSNLGVLDRQSKQVGKRFLNGCCQRVNLCVPGGDTYVSVHR